MRMNRATLDDDAVGIGVILFETINEVGYVESYHEKSYTTYKRMVAVFGCR